jgi:5-methylcytosine-specific restriction endonuclease McrA
MKPKKINLLLEENDREIITEEMRNLLKKKECDDITPKERSRLWYLQHRKEKIKKSLEWQKSNPDKVFVLRHKHRRSKIFKRLAKRANNSSDLKIKPFDLWKIAKKQKLKCALTGDKLTKNNVSLDHIKPKSKGGKNTIENIRLTTKDANWLKNTHSDEELLELCCKVINTLKK